MVFKAAGNPEEKSKTVRIMEEMAEQRFDALEEKSEDCDDCESYDDQDDDMSSIATPDM